MIYPSVSQVDDWLEMSDDSRSRNTQERASYVVGNVAFGLHIRSSNTSFLSAVGQKLNQKTTDPTRPFLLIGERILSLIFDKLIGSITKELVKSRFETGSKNQSQTVNLWKSVYLRILSSVHLGTRTRLASFLPFI